MKKKLVEKQPTTRDVLNAVNSFATHTEQRFSGIEGRLGHIESQMGTMVTKDYLDEKLFDLRGDIITVIRKEDTKVRHLAGMLYNKHILSEKDLKALFEMEPFAEISLSRKRK